METVKTAVGLGSKKDDSGEEPVSGETGEGTTAQPFDGGNSDEAQEVGPETAKAQPEQLDSKDSEQKHTNSSSGGGSSWNPFSSSKKQKDEEKDVKAGAEKEDKATPLRQDDESSRPPNHLGVNVPEGHSLDFTPSQPEQLSQAESKKMADSETNPPINDGPAGGQLSPSSPGGSTAATQKLRGSRASIAAPAGTRIFNPAGQNPGRIPTAGGQVVGARASEDRRRRSVWSSTDEGSGSPPLDKQGSPDPVTQNNTVANTVPQSPSANGEGSSKMAEQGTFSGVAPVEEARPVGEKQPDFNTFAWGEGGEGAATTAEKDKTDAAAATTTTPTTTTTTEANGSNSNTKSSTAEKAEDLKEKVKENLPTTGGNTKERRGSRFDAFKSKLGVGKKS